MAADSSPRAPYAGAIETGMVFDFEPGKKHKYERLTITKQAGQHLWARGRSGQTYYDVREFGDHAVPAPRADL